MLCCAKLPHSAPEDVFVLVELRLENYAVIDNAAVEFASGLNLLTGETGAGKSILIDALALLLGDKASSEVIRIGAERAVVAAVFECAAAAEVAIEKVLENNGLDESEDGSLIVRREIAAGGKGRVFVNNQAATGAASGDHPRAERINSSLRRSGAAGAVGWICWEPGRTGGIGIRSVEGN